jgi:glycosyltransferase involved in cell wall biosynthesis
VRNIGGQSLGRATPRNVVRGVDLSRALVIGHFPPPVHGQAVATEALADVGAGLGHNVTRVDTSGPGLAKGPRYYLMRASKLARTVLIVVWHSRRGGTAHLGVDAGAGLASTLLLGRICALLRYEVYLHHHSFNYMAQPAERITEAFARLGPRVTHIVTCEEMKRQFSNAFGAELICKVISVGYAISSEPVAERTRRSEIVRIGMLGNLGRSKSLDLVLGTFDEVATDSSAIEVAVAGPVIDEEGRAWLDESIEKHPGRVKEIGPAYGAEKASFIASLDVFLFPTRHIDESFGLVVLEALRHGVPVVMIPNRCFGAHELGEAGLVIENHDQFSTLAAEQIQTWIKHPDQYLRAQEVAEQIATAHLFAADSAIAALWGSPNVESDAK